MRLTNKTSVVKSTSPPPVDTDDIDHDSTQIIPTMTHSLAFVLIPEYDSVMCDVRHDSLKTMTATPYPKSYEHAGVSKQQML